MSVDERDDTAPAPGEPELTYLRRRVWKLSDENRASDVRFAKIEAELRQVENEVLSLREKGATSEQVTAAVALISLKIENIHGDLALIKNAIYAVIGIVAAGLIGGVLMLLLRPELVR